MPAPLEVPDQARLAALGLEAAVGEEPWVRTVSLGAADGGAVVLTWDEVAASVHLTWTDGDTVLAEVTRETVASIVIGAHDDGHVITIRSRSEGLEGLLTVTVAADVLLRDSMLRL